MVECWAESLENCSSKQSLEHTVSRSVFSTKTVKVQGFAWCKEEKEIGLSSLGAKILCSKHNSDLSPLDTEAGRLMDAFDYAVALNKSRSSIKPKRWSVHQKTVSGPLFERWMLKTLINLAQKDARNAYLPFGHMLDILFRGRPFPDKMGLYSTGAIGDEVTVGRNVAFKPLRKDDRLTAGIFRFAGFEFVIAVGEIRNFFAGKGAVLRRQRFRFKAGKYPSVEINFDW